MSGPKQSAESQRLIALYAQAAARFAKAAAAVGEIGLAYEVNAFEQAWRICDELQGLCREIHRHLYDTLYWQESGTTATRSKGEAVLIIDDQVVFRRGLKQTLAEEFPSARVREIRKSKEALLAVTGRRWSIVILQVPVHDRRGLDILGEILRQKPQMKVLVLMDRADDHFERRLLRMGAYGCISKDASPVEVTSALRAVLSGVKYVGRSPSEKLSSGSPSLRGANNTNTRALSDRERQIAIELAAGKSPTETARDLNLSVKTISTYKRRILNKLQLDSMAELVRYAIDHKLS